MKATDWEFKGYLPDMEDVEARILASEKFFSLPEIPSRNAAEEVYDAFNAGFLRGIAWQQAKQKED